MFTKICQHDFKNSSEILCTVNFCAAARQVGRPHLFGRQAHVVASREGPTVRLDRRALPLGVGYSDDVWTTTVQWAKFGEKFPWQFPMNSWAVDAGPGPFFSGPISTHRKHGSGLVPASSASLPKYCVGCW